MDDKGESKKRYETPKLTILARGNPEEAVLATCKYTSKKGPSSAAGSCKTSGNSCGWGSNDGSTCPGACSVLSSS